MAGRKQRGQPGRCTGRARGSQHGDGRTPAASGRRAAGGVPAVRLTGVRRMYGQLAAVAGVDLEIAEGEFFTMLGPSGSGKTTLLRLIAGFERPDAGTVELGGVDVTREPPYAAQRQHGVPGLRALPAHDRARERRVRAAGPPGAPAERRRRARAALDMVRLAGLGEPQAGPAFRRPAAAGRARPRDRQRAARCSCSTSRSARST